MLSCSLQEVLAKVQQTVATVVGREVAAEEPLMAAGLDSLGSVELRNALEADLAVQLPSTLTFDHPTSAAIAALVTSKMGPATVLRQAEPSEFDLTSDDEDYMESDVQEMALDSVKVQIAEAVQGILGSAVDASQPLMAAGLDSLAAVELKNSLSGKYDIVLILAQ